MPPAVVREAEKDVHEVHVSGGANRVHEDLGRRAAALRLDRLGEAPLCDAEAVHDVRPRDPPDEARDVEKRRHEDEAEKGRARRAPTSRGKGLHESGGPERRQREDERSREGDPARVSALGVAREESAREEDRDGEEEEAFDAGACDADRGADQEEGAHARQNHGPVGVSMPGDGIPAHEEQRCVVVDVREKGASRSPPGPREDREIPHVRRQALRLASVRECQGCDDDELREKGNERQSACGAISRARGGDEDGQRQRESEARRGVSRRTDPEQRSGRDRPRERRAPPSPQAGRGGSRHDRRRQDDVARPPRLRQKPE